MAASNYWLCSGCDRKVLYIGEDDTPEGAQCFCAACAALNAPWTQVEAVAARAIEAGKRNADLIGACEMARRFVQVFVDDHDPDVADAAAAVVDALRVALSASAPREQAR